MIPEGTLPGSVVWIEESWHQYEPIRVLSNANGWIIGEFVLDKYRERAFPAPIQYVDCWTTHREALQELKANYEVERDRTAILVEQTQERIDRAIANGE